MTHQNNGLFADYYLNEIVPTLPQWNEALFSAGKATFEQIKTLRQRVHPETLDEAQLEEQWIKPILAWLGHHFAVQVKLRYRERGYRKPDYLLMQSPDQVHALTKEIYTPVEIQHALAVADAKQWGVRLDQAAGGERNPSQQIDEYLRYSELEWGILTDGRYWRLYHRDSSKYNQFYAIDLQSLLDFGTPEQFQYFYAFFRREAFATDWLKTVREGSEAFAENLTDTLENEVYDALELIAQGFLDYRRNRLSADQPGTLREIYEQSLVLLYRLLFIFYGESRAILPMDNADYRTRLSLTAIKHDIRDALKFSKPLDPDSSHFYTKLQDLFFNIDAGNPRYHIPAYNGHLFADAAHPFLRDHVVGDTYLVPALDKLARVDVTRNRQIERVFVDYRDLEVRHLGSVYEKLLEYELDIAREPLTVKGQKYVPASPGETVEKQPGQVYLRTGSHERKVTGSYYTPDYIVRFIVEKTLDPVLHPIREQYATLDEEGNWKVHDAPTLIRAVLALNILDPATGSGHFAVDATAYIAEWLRALSLRPADLGEEDELIYWKRQVASACIYAVDINPLAVELAKLSMWLTTLAKNKPLSFLDHHIRVGNSLVGATMQEINSDPDEEKRRKKRAKQAEKDAAIGQATMFSDADFAEGVRFAVAQMSQIENTLADHVSDVKKQEEMYAALTERLSAWQQAADVWTARSFGFAISSEDWKAVRAMTAKKMVSVKVQKLVVQAQQIAEQQRFFHWELAFPEIFFDASGQPLEQPGFDAVIGNPPYVRQESLRPIKDFLQAHYPDVYNGAADIYVYFYERGLQMLRQGRLLSYITPNKWLSAGYGEGLRGYLAENAHTQQIVNFGHAPIFRNVDTFPLIAVIRKAARAEGQQTELCEFPREELVKLLKQSEQTDLNRYIQEHSFSVSTQRFSKEAWNMESSETDELIQKIKQDWLTLTHFIHATPLYGIKTGFNEAFLIDTETKNRLVAADAKAANIIKPYLRGQDVKRWLPEWNDVWMILLKSSENEAWAWKDSGEKAESVFAASYPSVYQHMKTYEAQLKKRTDQGKYWWELRTTIFYEAFAKPKLILQQIQFYPAYCYDKSGLLTNNKCTVLPTNDHYLLAVLNSPLMWWYSWRHLAHMKDDALYPGGDQFANLPIAQPTPEIRAEVESAVTRQLHLTKEVRTAIKDVLDWLKVEFNVATPGNKLQAFASLSEEDFIEEVRNRGKMRLSPAGLRSLKENFASYAPQVRTLEQERTALEHRLSDLVNEAYCLTPADIDLMWRTAPPRMPIARLG